MPITRRSVGAVPTAIAVLAFISIGPAELDKITAPK